jgi:hypothetical protein
MGTFRRSGSIVSTQLAQTMLNSGFGIDWTLSTTAGGPYYAKNGLWENGNGQLEQGVLFYLPEDMELVVLVNSPVCARYLPNQSVWVPEFLYSVVSDVYLNTLS